MKVLWITDYPFAYHNNLLGIGQGPIASGSWLYAAYEGARNDAGIELYIATVANVSEIKQCSADGCVFYVLPGGDMSNYDINSELNKDWWKRLKNNVEPDILCIWGTESKFAYTAAKVFMDVIKLVYIQGVIGSIVHHFYDGVPTKYKYKTLRDFVGIVTGKDAYQIFRKHISLENEILNLADGIIVENDWGEDQCVTVNPKLDVYRNYLPIRLEFYKYKWDLCKVERYSIFTNAGGVSIKGHHILFQALGIVKTIYPNVKVYIPGINYIGEKRSIRNRTGYFSLLFELYDKFNLHENIVFTGTLTADQMGERIAKSHIYVMPSMVENHSSSLIEAMIVGSPCISSFVGGVASLIVPSKNGILYNSLEYTSLAGCIIRLFSNDDLSRNMAAEAFKIRESRKQDFGKSMMDIYRKAIAKKNYIKS